MIAFLAFVGLFMPFYITSVALRNRRLRILAQGASQKASVVSGQTRVGASKLTSQEPSGPTQYTCVVDGRPLSYKRGTSEYDLIQEAILHM